MKKSLLHRFPGIVLLSLLMVLALSAMCPSVFADYDDGRDCWLCDHYHWDEYMCDDCGACSAECTSADCFVASHCNECGDCLALTMFCEECRTCEQCYVNNGWHCLGCGECYFTDEESLCGECWFCEGCMGPFCNECGFCEGCQELDGGVHCPECYNCYNVTEICVDKKEHCIECCVICESCEACLYEEGVDLCDTCGLCPDCCLEQAEASDCDCGEFCVESSEWFEHLCPDCGIPFCQTESCELCGLCQDCCQGMSDCPEGMCILDDDYDLHFCEDCGECSHSVDLCETCGDVGELRCGDCCAVLTEEQGCDCGDRCFNDGDFELHVQREHLGGGDKTHEPAPKAEWEMDGSGHWHSCRFCDDHTYLGHESHDLNKYGVCTDCGFDVYAKILILKQPRSRVARLTDYYAGEGEPLNQQDNTVHFNIAATGQTALTYQWQMKYEDGPWIVLTDEMTQWWDSGNSFYTVHGSKTPNLTVSVSPEACHVTLYYRCIVTDEEGNSEESSVAALRCAHLYRGRYVPIVGSELKNIIFQENGADNIGVYETVSHELWCIGEGCESYKEEPHHYSKVTKSYINKGYNAYGQPVGDGAVWIEYTCMDCGAKKYEKYHDHYFIDPETGDCEVDYSYESAMEHQLKCLHDGCQKTTRESHAWMGWQHMGTPHTNGDGIGIAYRECRVCSYQNTARPEAYDAGQDKMVRADWTKDNDLVTVRYGTASTDLTKIKQAFYITFSPTAYDKTNSIGKENPVCVTWNTYYTYETTPGAAVTVDVSDDVALILQDDGPRWKVIIYDFSQYIGGGIFTFEPVIRSTGCDHSRGVYIRGAYAPICVKDGYTGDTVCKDCGYVVAYGDTIEAPGHHEGELVLNPLTVQKGTCDHRGYSGTSRCTACGMAVRGKSTPKVHTGQVTLQNYVAPTCGEFGYSGDAYCSCGTLLKTGKLLAPEHDDVSVVGYIAPTTNSKGYSGDLVCNDCGVTLKYGYDIRADQLITGIVINDLAQPVAGQKPDYTVTLDSAGYSLDTGATQYRQNGIMWKRANYADPMYSNGSFLSKQSYQVYITLHADSFKHFAADMTATVNGQPATVTFLNDPRYVVVEYEFRQIPEAYIRQVELTGVMEPVEGEWSGWGVTLDSDLYYVDEFSWTEDGEYFGDGPFVMGKQYSIGILLRTEVVEGFFQCRFDENVQVTVNGRPATVVDVHEDDYNGSSVYFIYDCLPVGRYAQIVKQPADTAAAAGTVAKVKVDATGTGLTYTWYYKNKGASKFTRTDSFKGDTYSVEMNKDRDGRQIYCVVGDQYGSKIATVTVTLSMKNVATITTQPQNATAPNGSKATVTVKATGEGLTYKWYYKSKGESTFSLTTAFQGNSYSVQMNASRDGRQVYCVVTDKYGNSVKSNTVTIYMGNPLKITAQPQSVTAPNGATAKVAVKATGDGLTYKWYYKSKGQTAFSLTTAFKSNTYSVQMNSSRAGRQVYCVITDKYGNSVTTNTVTLNMGTAIAITTQPQSVSVVSGDTAKVTVQAVGEGLTYKWYYKNKGASTFALTKTFTGNTYTLEMNTSRSGRQIYCVITDKFGNSVKTDVVTLTMKVKINTQPVSVTVASGKTASVTVKATGEGLTYKWYYKSKGQTSFSLTTSFTGNTYSVQMNSSRAGRQVYCVVTDKYGNSVKSNVVTLNMGTTLAITTQPKSVSVASGATAKVTVQASGEGLTYKWYYKNKGDSTFTLTTAFKTNTYSVQMNASRAGRQIYCVITDQYGNKIQTVTVTLNMN